MADFGLARLNEGLLASATFCGTMAYMPPENWQGKVSLHSDQYSLAFAYAELRTGRRPFSGSRSMAEVMLAHLNEVPDLQPLGEHEQRVLLKALAKNPADRYPTCLEFAQALDECLKPVLPRVVPHEEADQATDPGSLVVNPRSRINDTKSWSDTAPLPPQPRRSVAWPILLGGMLLILGAFAGLIGYQYIVKAPPTPSSETTEPTVLLPGFVQIGDESEKDLSKKQYYKQIARPVPDSDLRIIFVLVPKSKGSDPETFYIMQDKVSVDLFRIFANSHPGEVKSDEWNKDDEARYPVLGMTVGDAYLFAQWLGGNLPTFQQWDKAAGYHEENRGEGPYLGRWNDVPKPEIALARTTPMRVGEAKGDRTPFGYVT